MSNKKQFVPMSSPGAPDGGSVSLGAPPPKRGIGILGKLIFLLLLTAFGVCGFAAWDIHRFLSTPGSREPKEIIFSVEPGSTFDRVAADLFREGAITDVTRFRLLARYHDAYGKIRAGEFLINTGRPPTDVLNQLIAGRSVLYRLSIREGLPWWETAKAIEQQGFATFEDVKAVIHDPEFLAKFAVPFSNAEGFLFPETYLLQKPREPLDRQQAEEVVAVMLRTFWKKTAPAWNALPLKQGVTITAEDRVASPYAPSTAPVVIVREAKTAPDAPLGVSPGVSLAAPSGRSDDGSGGALGEVSPETTAGSSPGTSPGASQEASNAATDPPGAPGSAPENPSGDSAGNASGAASVPAADAAATSAAAGRQVFSALPAWRPDGPQRPSDVDPAALRRLVILASLVEKETAVPLERARVAGVYANRLRIGMLLQCDPTIIYGVGESFSGSIRRSQLNDAGNLYNTYKHAGLPPGPICSFGTEAMAAAAVPERHDLLFFVADGLGTGGHIFSKNASDHEKAVRLYRARLRQAGGR